MRILSIGNMYPPHDLGGGYELTWRSAVEHLRARGHSVRVLTTDYRAPGVGRADDPDVHRELRSYWRDHSFPRMSLRERMSHERHNAWVLERHLGEHAPDVVNWWGMGAMSLGLIERVRQAGLPAVGVVGDEWMVWGPRADGWLRPFRGRRGPGRLAEWFTGLPSSVDLGGAGAWLFNSARTRDASMAAGWELPDARVAHPGIDDKLFRPAVERDWSWRLLYVGRMDDRKGVHVAVEALALLPGDATLSLQGSGEEGYVRELRARVDQLGLGDRVRWPGRPRDELADLYTESDAVLFPVQWEEPWGLVPLEAMAVGRPVVASGTGGSAEYLRDGENALMYEPRDSAEALAAAVRRLAAEPGLRSRLRAGGFETAQRFTERAYNEAIAAAIESAPGG